MKQYCKCFLLTVLLFTSGCSPKQCVVGNENSGQIQTSIIDVSSTVSEPETVKENSSRTLQGNISSAEKYSSSDPRSNIESKNRLSDISSKYIFTSSSLSQSTNPPKQEPITSNPPEVSSRLPPYAEKSPYAYPFDIDAVKKDLIAYGESLGMKHCVVTDEPYLDMTTGELIPVGTLITPPNSSWWGEYILSKTAYPNPEQDKQQLYDYVKHDCEKFELTKFTIYAEPLSDGAYQIYVLR